MPKYKIPQIVTLTLEMSQIMHLEKDSVKKRLKRIRMEKMKADSGVTLEELLRRF